MAKRIKIIVCNDDFVNKQLTRALSLINQRQNYFAYSIDHNNALEIFLFPINWHSIEKTYKEKYSDGFYMFITDKPFMDNWFSHVNDKVCIISTHGWDECFAPPHLYVFLMYEIIECSINFEVDLTEDKGIDRIMHTNSIGCLFDFCQKKSDIKLGMRAGFICSSCESKLRDYGIDNGAIKAAEGVLELIRNHTINRNITLNHIPIDHRITILFFATNPRNTGRLRLDEEVRNIAQGIRLADNRENLRLVTRFAVKPKDILQAINETNPSIIHFSGHGSDNGELVLEGLDGNAILVKPEAISQAISTVSNYVKLVVFNTCFSRDQAQNVTRYINASIGMNTSISDRAACAFASQLYSSIGFNLSLENAFNQARASILLEGIDESQTPELFCCDSVKANKMFF